MHDDYSLLRRYADQHESAAFAELVDRYVNFVYNVALRRANGDARVAADATQSTFVALARNAGRLAPDTVLAAWLHRTSRSGIEQPRKPETQRPRETKAAAPKPTGAASADWEMIRPVLDEAVDELLESDRAPLVLRLFRRLSFAEIGAALAVSEDTARMHVERGLERLRVILEKRGVTLTATALAATITAGPAFPAPAGLAASIVSEAGSGTGAGALGKNVRSLFSVRTVAAAVLAAILGFFAGTRFAPSSAPEPAAPTGGLQQTILALQRDNDRLQREVAAYGSQNSKLLSAVGEASRASASPAPATRHNPSLGIPLYEIQRGILNNLKQIASARDQYELEHGHPPATIEDLVGGPNKYIRRVQTVGGEDYSQLAVNGRGPITVTTPDGVSVTFDPSGATTTKPDVPPEVLHYEELKRKVDPTIGAAVEAYRAAHGEDPPTDPRALVPYFATPQEGADFLEVIEAGKHQP
jgi:RNA polymerase sigma factor (sigma-70 family)